VHIITDLWDLLHCVLHCLVCRIVRRGRWRRTQIFAASRHTEMVFSTSCCRIFVAICEVYTIRIQRLMEIRVQRIRKTRDFKGKLVLKVHRGFHSSLYEDLSSGLLRRVGWGIVAVNIYRHEFIGIILHYFESGWLHKFTENWKYDRIGIGMCNSLCEFMGNWTYIFMGSWL